MITDKDQTTVWDLVDRWADSGPPEDKKAALRERIRRWLFASEWVEESFDELENQDFSYQAREKRTRLSGRRPCAKSGMNANSRASRNCCPVATQGAASAR